MKIVNPPAPTVVKSLLITLQYWLAQYCTFFFFFFNSFSPSKQSQKIISLANTLFYVFIYLFTIFVQVASLASFEKLKIKVDGDTKRFHMHTRRQTHVQNEIWTQLSHSEHDLRNLAALLASTLRQSLNYLVDQSPNLWLAFHCSSEGKSSIIMQDFASKCQIIYSSNLQKICNCCCFYPAEVCSLPS